jgi:hypothetical protein
MSDKPTLSAKGQHLRERLAESGIEITPDGLAESVDEALDRVGTGCRFCGNPDVETRFGMCYPCFEKGENTHD